MRKFCLILLFFLLSVDVNAQMITNRDSLKQVRADAKEDTTKVNALWNLGFSYAFVHQDSAIMYVSEGLELSKKAGYLSGKLMDGRTPFWPLPLLFVWCCCCSSL